MEKINKKVLILILIVIILAIFLVYFMQETEEEYVLDMNEIYEEEKIIEETEITMIKIHIIGEVAKPGIIEIKEGERIADAIEKAGGLTEEADVSRVNLAYVLQDGQKVYIPSIYDEDIKYIEETAGNNVIIEDEIGTRNIKININTATQTELETLPGVGPSTALKIINYREENGKFASAEEIMKVSGIGEVKYEAIKDYVSVK